MSKIYLIRHGQASYLSEDYDNLSEKGKLQSEALGRYFADNNIHFDKVFIGKLNRHQQTFDGFTSAFSTNGITLPNPIYLEELNEHQAPEALSFTYDDFVNQYDEAKKWTVKLLEVDRYYGVRKLWRIYENKGIADSAAYFQYQLFLNEDEYLYYFL